MQEYQMNKRPKYALRIAALAMACTILGGAGGFGAGWLLGAFPAAAPEAPVYAPLESGAPLTPSAPSPYIPASATDSMTFTDMSARDALCYVELYDQCAPAVVAINCVVTVQNIWGRTQDSRSTGSGFFISSNGYILTNHHVVNGASSITVTLAGGETRDAAIIGSREDSDLALLRVEGEGYPFLPLGDSDNLKVGLPIAAIGNPLGSLAGTMTEGIISGMNRDITIRNFNETMLQISAAVSPGNSGGPVLNMQGEVVGIVTAKSQENNSEGIGFAIPSNTVRVLVDDIMAGITGAVTLGVDVQTVTAELAAQHNLPLGQYVTAVRPGGNAARAGLRTGDVITAFNGNAIRTLEDLRSNLAVTRDGETVSLTISRAASQNARTVMTLTVKVIAPQPLAA